MAEISNINAGYEAVRTHFDQIVTVTMNKSRTLSLQAFAKRLIDDYTLRKTMDDNTSYSAQATNLALAVLAAIKEKPSYFDTFVSILADSNSDFSDLAERLRTTKEQIISSAFQPPIQESSADSKSTNDTESPVLPVNPIQADTEPTHNIKSPISPFYIHKEKPDSVDKHKLHVHGDMPFGTEEVKKWDESTKASTEASLRSNTQAMILQFSRLLSSTKKSLTERKIQPDDVVTTVFSLSSMGTDAFHKPLTQEDEQHLLSTLTISRVFLRLAPYMSFFNHVLLKQIIEELGTEDDLMRLEEFLRSFKYFCRESMFRGPVSISLQTQEDQNEIYAAILCESGVNAIGETPKHVLRARERFAEVLDVDMSMLHLFLLDEGNLKPLDFPGELGFVLYLNFNLNYVQLHKHSRLISNTLDRYSYVYLGITGLLFIYSSSHKD